MPSALNAALMRLPKRAETTDPRSLVQTFVDVGALFRLLSSRDHQVLYGRRGTGKTHALQYLVETLRDRDEAAVYIDMRLIGSTGGIYNDESASFAERATRLIMDTLGAVHEALSRLALEEAAIASGDLQGCLDALAASITQVRVVGSVEREQRDAQEGSAKVDSGVTVSAAPDKVGFSASAGAQETATTRADLRLTEKGNLVHRVHFGAVGKALTDCVAALAQARLWIVLDEWSAVPPDLQPYLADLIRRAMLPIRGVTVKIGAIEHRSRFRIVTKPPDYVGFELGADIAADLDLDDFMVFNNDSERAKSFFRELLFKHVRAVLAADGSEAPTSPEQVVTEAFTQRNAFDEFVRAAEGVPRDAVNILSLASQRAGEELISVNHVRVAAQTWYQRDKVASLAANTRANRLLHWIIDEVIGQRHARAFLLEQSVDFTNPLIGGLYDSRVLHVLKRGVAAQDRPGVRFNVYSLDYGCYVDLIATAKAPKGLFEVETSEAAPEYVEVPADDYRSIRRAILDLCAFESAELET